MNKVLFVIIFILLGGILYLINQKSPTFEAPPLEKEIKKDGASGYCVGKIVG